MTIMEQAQNELDLFLKSEEKKYPNTPDMVYMNQQERYEREIACKNALDAFRCMHDNDLSFSHMDLTIQLLTSLVNGRPLTPLEDTDDMWELVKPSPLIYTNDQMYHHKRYPALTKTSCVDGTINYYDSYYCMCVDIENSDSLYYNEYVNEFISKLFPITMPYLPKEPMKVVCEEFKVDLERDENDTIGIYYVVLPSGIKMDVNVFNTKKGAFTDKFIEISMKEFLELKAYVYFRDKEEGDD